MPIGRKVSGRVNTAKAVIASLKAVVVVWLLDYLFRDHEFAREEGAKLS